MRVVYGLSFLLVCVATATATYGQQSSRATSPGRTALSRSVRPAAEWQGAANRADQVVRTSCQGCEAAGTTTWGGCADGGCGQGNCGTCSTAPAMALQQPACYYVEYPRCYRRYPCPPTACGDACCKTIFHEMACDVRDFFGKLHGLSLTHCGQPMSCVDSWAADCGVESAAVACVPAARPLPEPTCGWEVATCAPNSTGCGSPCFQDLLPAGPTLGGGRLLGSLGDLLFGSPCSVASCSTGFCEPDCGIADGGFPAGCSVEPDCGIAAGCVMEPDCGVEPGCGVESCGISADSCPTCLHGGTSSAGVSAMSASPARRSTVVSSQRNVPARPAQTTAAPYGRPHEPTATAARRAARPASAPRQSTPRSDVQRLNHAANYPVRR